MSWYCSMAILLTTMLMGHSTCEANSQGDQPKICLMRSYCLACSSFSAQMPASMGSSIHTALRTIVYTPLRMQAPDSTAAQHSGICYLAAPAATGSY